MSENNDGGFAERGNTVGTAGGLAQPGGSNTSSGGTGSSSGTSGGTTSDKQVGMSNPTVNYNSVKPTTNYSSTYGELISGARAPIVPGYGYTPRRDQTLGDIQEQNRIGNANYTGNSVSGSQGSAGNVPNPQRQPVVWNPVAKKYVPVPQPKPAINPATGLPFASRYRSPYPVNATVKPQNYGFANLNPYINNVSPYGFEWDQSTNIGSIYDWEGRANAGTNNARPGGSLTLGPEFGDDPSHSGDIANPGYNSGGFNSTGGIGPMGPHYGGARKFGGEVSSLPTGPRRYRVGENGAEDLVMTAGSGYVVPNPKDRNHPQARRMANRVFGAGRPPPHIYGGYPGGVRT